MPNYLFHTTCVSANADDIHEMQQLSGIGHQCREDLRFKELQEHLGADFWRNYADTASFFKNDPYIYAHQSSYQGFPCIYIKASGIEHVYLQHNTELMLGNGYTCAFSPLEDNEREARSDLLDALGEHDAIEQLSVSLTELCSTFGDAQQAQLKGERFNRTLTRAISSHPELFQQVILHYNQLTADHGDTIRDLRITPAAILVANGVLPFSLLDKACTLLDLINTQGPSLGLDLSCSKPALTIKADADIAEKKAVPEPIIAEQHRIRRTSP